MITPPVRFAAFDVDGTLTTRDCVVPFLRRVGGTAGVGVRMLADGRRVIPAVARRDRDSVKAAAARATFRGRLADEVGAEAERFAEVVAAQRMRADIVNRLDAHRRDGDTIVFVSASFELYLEPLAELLGGADVLATKLVIDEAGRFTGELDGPNCRGPEKVRRLHAWLAEHHDGRAAVHVTAYGDSAGDHDLLRDADVAHWVGRGSGPS